MCDLFDSGLHLFTIRSRSVIWTLLQTAKLQTNAESFITEFNHRHEKKWTNVLNHIMLWLMRMKKGEKEKIITSCVCYWHAIKLDCCCRLLLTSATGRFVSVFVSVYLFVIATADICLYSIESHRKKIHTRSAFSSCFLSRLRDNWGEPLYHNELKPIFGPIFLSGMFIFPLLSLFLANISRVINSFRNNINKFKWIKMSWEVVFDEVLNNVE